MRYYHDPRPYRTHPNGSVEYRTPPPFSSIARIESCLCEDGVRRLVLVTGEPDTFFSVPATCRVQGKHVSGFISYRGSIDGDREGWEFIANSYGRNGHLIATPRRDADTQLSRLETARRETHGS